MIEVRRVESALFLSSTWKGALVPAELKGISTLLCISLEKELGLCFLISLFDCLFSVLLSHVKANIVASLRAQNDFSYVEKAIPGSVSPETP